MSRRPVIELLVKFGQNLGHECNDDRGQCSAGYISRCHQNSRTLVGLSIQLVLAQMEVLEPLAQLLVHEPADQPADQDRARGQQRQIDPYRKSQRRYAGHFQNDGDHHTQQDQTPGQLVTQYAFDDIRHEHGLRRVVLGYRSAIRPCLVGAVYAGVFEINRDAVAIHQIPAGGSPHIVKLMPGVIESSVVFALNAFELFLLGLDLGHISPKVRREVILYLEVDLARLIYQVATRLQARRTEARLRVQDAISARYRRVEFLDVWRQDGCRFG